MTVKAPGNLHCITEGDVTCDNSLPRPFHVAHVILGMAPDQTLDLDSPATELAIRKGLERANPEVPQGRGPVDLIVSFDVSPVAPENVPHGAAIVEELRDELYARDGVDQMKTVVLEVWYHRDLH